MNKVDFSFREQRMFHAFRLVRWTQDNVLTIYDDEHTIADLWPDSDGWQSDQLEALAKALKAIGLKQALLKFDNKDVIV